MMGVVVKYRWWVAVCVLPLVFLPAPALAVAAAPERVTVSLAGGEPNGMSGSISFSADGRFVAFESEASDLVPGDTNGTTDVFVRDRLTGTTRLGSVRPDGTTGNESSYEPEISDDGRYLAFSSPVNDLVPGDTNGKTDVFVRDLQAGSTVRASVNDLGEELNDASYLPAISADGRYVAFASKASNLPFIDKNGIRWEDVFLRDMVTGAVSLVSRSVTGTGGNYAGLYAQISGDGRYVAFRSRSTNLVPDGLPPLHGLFVRDMLTGSMIRTTVSSTGVRVANTDASMSRNGRYVAFGSIATDVVPGDTNGRADVFVHDLRAGEVELVSVGDAGQQGDGESVDPSISDDGRCVLFDSYAGNFDPTDLNGTGDVYLRDRTAGTTTRVTRSASGGDADSRSYASRISADGRHAAYVSPATNLQSPPDPGGHEDIFAQPTGCA